MDIVVDKNGNVEITRLFCARLLTILPELHMPDNFKFEDVYDISFPRTHICYRFYITFHPESMNAERFKNVIRPFIWMGLSLDFELHVYAGLHVAPKYIVEIASWLPFCMFSLHPNIIPIIAGVSLYTIIKDENHRKRIRDSYRSFVHLIHVRLLPLDLLRMLKNFILN